MAVLEKEVVLNDGNRYLRRIRPYRTRENYIDGVVIAFIDISALTRAERQLAVVKRRLAAILDAVVDGIVGVGAGGVIGEFNSAAERLFACPASKARGQPLQRFLKPASAQADEEGSILQLLDDRFKVDAGMLPCEGVRTTGGRFPTEVRAVAVDEFGGYMLLVRDVSERRELGRQIVESSTLEQQRIGQLIHNGLGQQLTAVAMLASALTRKLETLQCPEAAEARHLEDHLEQALTDSRAIIRGLSPVGIEPERLSEALERLADQVGAATVSVAPCTASPTFRPRTGSLTHIFTGSLRRRSKTPCGTAHRPTFISGCSEPRPYTAVRLRRWKMARQARGRPRCTGGAYHGVSRKHPWRNHHSPNAGVGW